MNVGVTRPHVYAVVRAGDLNATQDIENIGGAVIVQNSLSAKRARQGGKVCA